MRTVLLLIWFVLPTFAAAADRPISPEEFERIVKGETLSYIGEEGEYGAEEYFGNRRVRWSNLDGNCTEGYWYADGANICFMYDDAEVENPQCWSMFLRDDRLVAKFEGGVRDNLWVQTRKRSGPLYCQGPEVGA